MREFIALQQRIAPEIIELVERRYTILRTVSLVQPVGRRGLASKLKLGERVIRNEIEFLRDQGLMEANASGVQVTCEGEEVLMHLADFIKNLHGLAEMEQFIAHSLGLQKVIIVPGNCDEDEAVKRELGKVASRFIRSILREGSVLAVTGGTTLRDVAATMPQNHIGTDITVVPARGGLGEDVEVQANTIAATIAKRLKGAYRLLHVPDNITEEAMRLLLDDPNIRELTEIIKNADMLVHGIGNAVELSESRGDTPEQVKKLIKQGAVGEAFGNYFTKEGTSIRNIHSLGVKLNDIKEISMVVGVAGGARKAAAILAVLRNNQEDILITDQGAANLIVKLLRQS